MSDRTTSTTVKYGGGNNLMVWGCMGWNGVGKLIEVLGKMDAEQYCQILEDGVTESFEMLELAERADLPAGQRPQTYLKTGREVV